jgi:phage terminase large subunit-like protein
LINPWQTYINDVLSGERLAGRLERLAVERFCRLCEDDRYYFDEDVAAQIIHILSCFRHTKGKYYGKLWQLLPWQAFFFAYIFGLKYKDSNLRVVRKVLLCMAKKGGKSEVGGALGALMTYFDGEQGAECYSAANKYDQARFCWDAAKVMLKQLAQENEYIANNLKIYDSITTRAIQNDHSASFFKPISADAKTLDGVNPHLGIVDEYHEAADTSIPDNLESGMVAREQPLLAIVTTRGFNSRGVLRQLEDTYVAILEGKIENDSVFPLIFSLDEGDDWNDEEVWPKANPGIGITPSVEGLREQYKKAVTEGATSEVNFRTKNMNVWTNVASVWIQDEIWTRDTTDYKDADLLGRVCFAGLDLASTRDIAAFTMLFPPSEEGEKYKQITRYYCPEEQISERSRKDRVPYEQWVADGWLIATPGNVIDYDYIENDIAKAAELFDLQGVYYDRYNAAKVVPAVVESGIICEPFAQTPGTFNAPLKELERLAIGGMFDQGKDPIMRWMAGNVIIYMDGNGNIKFDKAKAREKIDGMVALGMAFGAYLAAKKDDDPYANMDWEGLLKVADKRK